MKKISTIITAMVLGLAFSAPAMADHIDIVGTGDGVKVLKAVGAAFSTAHPGVAISVPKSIGSGGGIKAVGKEKNVIGRVARKIKDKEKPYGLTYVPYAKGPVVFFINKSVGVKSLTSQQVCGIYSGQITNWKEVGGKDAKIRVVRREDGDSSLKVIKKSFPGFKDIAITSKSKTALSTPETFSIVENKKGTIGFGPYDVARDAKVDICIIDGINPTDPDYPSVVTLALIFKEKNNTGNIKKFLDFARSTTAHQAIKEAGGVPL